jgi:hypothetical protein
MMLAANGARCQSSPTDIHVRILHGENGEGYPALLPSGQCPNPLKRQIARDAK